jgi:hypothetical protein
MRTKATMDSGMRRAYIFVTTILLVALVWIPTANSMDHTCNMQAESQGTTGQAAQTNQPPQGTGGSMKQSSGATGHMGHGGMMGCCGMMSHGGMMGHGGMIGHGDMAGHGDMQMGQEMGK